jgi:tripartite-type tricarboxylate transporter receptor subunit TctC
MFDRKIHFACGFIAAVLGAVSPASAAEWQPTKPVRIIVPIVGSTNDILARLVAPELGKVLGQPVIVENKGGAGGIIGTSEVVRSAPDGQTLLVGYNGPISINPTLYRKLPYNPQKDLIPITLAVTTPQFLAVNPTKVPAKNVSEFVALSKTKPLSYGSVSIGSASHLTMEMLKFAAHADLTHVPYKGAPPAVTDLIGGQIDAAFLVPGNILQQAKDGQVRLIATSGAKRFPSQPDVPTMIEQGYPGFIATSWIGFFLPAGTPQAIVDRYNKEMVRILKDSAVRTRLEQIDFEVVANSSEEFAKWIREDTDRWGKVIKQAGVEPQ